MRRRSTATPAHHKSMGSYQLFAWRDAMEIAQLFESEYHANLARKIFESFSQEWLAKVEDVLGDDIAKMIAATPLRRHGILKSLRKTYKDADNLDEIIIAFLIICIIVQLRVENMIRLRDYYRAVMAPGAANRATCAGWYGFSREFAAIKTEYTFPTNVFEAYGNWSTNDDDDDFEDDDLE